MKRYDIPCSFTIPKGYRRQFVFDAGPVRESITVDELGIHAESHCEPGHPIPADLQSRCLDWIEESIMSVRFELGAEGV